MPIDLKQLLAPGHTALVTQEIQRGVIGDLSALPELAKEAGKAIPFIAKLVDAARAAGVPVIHATAERRADGFGANTNARLFQYMAKAEPKLIPGSDAAAIVPEIEVADSDLVLPRLHGISPFQGTELDFILRNLGVTTLVGVGVSVNVAITNFAFDAVNASYQMVIPRDAVAGTPPEYAEQVLQYTLRNIATVVTSDDVIAAWS
ncbi:MAG: cysteine hydrolase [Deltaproteobacteria bacterium]|nr:cysteine hydrolase [Deltaproteobacteria bacterium]MBW2392995.1 cysteine hydrolase [Deltaproteobacteria bacterium]